MNYNLTLKRHFENLTSGHDVIRKGHVAYQLIRTVGLNGVFVALSGLYQKLFPKKKLLVTFHDLK